jgi:hypothetical protein
MPVMGEPMKEVSPGFLPRTLDQLREGVENDARRPENRLRRRRLTSEEERPEETQQSLDSALDSLLAEAEDEETPRASQETASPTVEAPQAATPSQQISQPAGIPQAANRPRPMNRGEARLQRAREGFTRMFGTAQDIQQEDYESPLSTLYNRAENRYNQAEQNRATNTTAPTSLDGLSARERREIEDQLLWGVMRESAMEGEAEGSVWSYAPRRTQAGERSLPARQSAMRHYRMLNNRLPVRPATDTPTSLDAVTQDPNQSGASATSPPTLPSGAETSPAGMAMLLRHQARYEAMLADRMAEFERLQPNQSASTALDPSSSENIAVEGHSSTTGQSTNTPPSSTTDSSSSTSGTGMSQIQISIQQITSELHRLRLASEAITSARHSMHSHFQSRAPSPPPATLDNQPGRPAAMSEAEMTKKLECQVCYQQLADVALLPCGHMVMCVWCADVVIPVKHSHLPIRASKCPMCRKAVKQRFRIHM